MMALTTAHFILIVILGLIQGSDSDSGSDQSTSNKTVIHRPTIERGNPVLERNTEVVEAANKAVVETGNKAVVETGNKAVVETGNKAPSESDSQDDDDQGFSIVTGQIIEKEMANNKWNEALLKYGCLNLIEDLQEKTLDEISVDEIDDLIEDFYSNWMKMVSMASSMDDEEVTSVSNKMAPAENLVESVLQEESMPQEDSMPQEESITQEESTEQAKNFEESTKQEESMPQEESMTQADNNQCSPYLYAITHLRAKVDKHIDRVSKGYINHCNKLLEIWRATIKKVPVENLEEKKQLAVEFLHSFGGIEQEDGSDDSITLLNFFMVAYYEYVMIGRRREGREQIVEQIVEMEQMERSKEEDMEQMNKEEQMERSKEEDMEQMEMTEMEQESDKDHSDKEDTINYKNKEDKETLQFIKTKLDQISKAEKIIANAVDEIKEYLTVSPWDPETVFDFDFYKKLISGESTLRERLFREDHDIYRIQKECSKSELWSNLRDYENIIYGDIKKKTDNKNKTDSSNKTMEGDLDELTLRDKDQKKSISD